MPHCRPVKLAIPPRPNRGQVFYSTEVGLPFGPFVEVYNRQNHLQMIFLFRCRCLITGGGYGRGVACTRETNIACTRQRLWEVDCMYTRPRFLKDVSQKSFVFELRSSIFEGSLAEKLRFWASKLHFWRKSRRKASFLSFEAPIFEGSLAEKLRFWASKLPFLKEVLQKSFVSELRSSIFEGSLAEKLRFWIFEVPFLKEVLQKSFVFGVSKFHFMSCEVISEVWEVELWWVAVWWVRCVRWDELWCEKWSGDELWWEVELWWMRCEKWSCDELWCDEGAARRERERTGAGAAGSKGKKTRTPHSDVGN